MTNYGDSFDMKDFNSNEMISPNDSMEKEYFSTI